MYHNIGKEKGINELTHANIPRLKPGCQVRIEGLHRENIELNGKYGKIIRLSGSSTPQHEWWVVKVSGMMEIRLLAANLVVVEPELPNNHQPPPQPMYQQVPQQQMNQQPPIRMQKGVCVVCGIPVFSDQPRARTMEGSYVHEQCDHHNSQFCKQRAAW